MMNPITDFTSVEFLAFYATLVAAVGGFCFWYRRVSDPTRRLPPLEPANAVDPYELAYLRGGEDELARVVVVGLVERGFLELQPAENELFGRTLFRVPEPGIVATATRPAVGVLSPLEDEVYEWFAERRTILEMVRDQLPARLGPYCLPFEERLQQEHLLSADESWHRWPTAIAAAAMLVWIGGSRLLVALERDRPVGLLVVLMAAAVIVPVAVSTRKRVSARGEEYLTRLGDHVADVPESQGMPLALAVSLLGPSALAGTSLDGLGDQWTGSRPPGDEAGGCGACGGCGGCGGCG